MTFSKQFQPRSQKKQQNLPPKKQQNLPQKRTWAWACWRTKTNPSKARGKKEASSSKKAREKKETSEKSIQGNKTNVIFFCVVQLVSAEKFFYYDFSVCAWQPQQFSLKNWKMVSPSCILVRCKQKFWNNFFVLSKFSWHQGLGKTRRWCEDKRFFSSLECAIADKYLVRSAIRLYHCLSMSLFALCGFCDR